MNSPLYKALRLAAIAFAIVAYALLAHYSAATSAARDLPALGVAVALAPSLTILLILAWRSPRRALMGLLCAVVAGLLWHFWSTLERNFDWLYFIQHAGTNLMLAVVFGATLGAGRKSLCTGLAEVVHGSLSDEVVRYTRQVTLAWTLFFLAISLLSTLLFAFAPIQYWSIFANFLTFPLIVLMFAVEFWVRLRILPHIEHHSIIDGVRAYWKNPPSAGPGALTPPGR